MANTPPAANISRDAGDTEDDLLFVFALRPPARASAYDRAAGSHYPHILSDEPNVPLPSRGLHVVTELSQTGVDDDLGAQSVDEGSSGLPSPDPSSPGLRTPMDSPPSARALSKGKDDVPDIRHLFINNRAPAPSVSGPSLGVKNAAIGIDSRQAGSTTAPSSDKPEPRKPQFYQIVIDIPDDENVDINEPDSTEPYQLFIDTGSHDTFGFGEDIRKIRKPTQDFDEELRSSWTLEDVRIVSGHTLLPHGFDTRLINDELRFQGFVLGRMNYADKAVAHLILMEPRTFILRCYDRKRKLTHPVCLFWRFGVAVAVNSKFWKDPTSGMLGLGPSGIQHAYIPDSNGTVTPPSFLAAIEDKLKPIPTSRPGEKLALFFCLRLAPECYRDIQGPIQSWMSFNIWPCLRQPAWNNRKIVVCPSEPHYRQWAVYLRSIKFYPLDKDTNRPVPLEDLHMILADATLDFLNSRRPRGLMVLLDTGSSLTYLPLDAVQRMNQYLFKNEGAVKAPQGNLPLSKAQTYVVDPNCWVLSPQRKIQVVYEFEGDGSTPVFVSGPLETFAYQDNPLHPGNPEGLVYPINTSDGLMGTLGQNFFQTMYVSLHKATDGVDFVRLAGQWPERLTDDLRDYYVAGLSSP